MSPRHPRGGGAATPRHGPTPVAPPPDEVAGLARTSYRYLRVSVVALCLLLAASLTQEIAAEGGERFGSISGYYYSPVRSVFVASLVAIGVALIAIKGRPGWEDALLDLAGMLAPVVALVPTPLPEERAGLDCPGAAVRCVPVEYLPSVANNVAALAVVGAAGLVFAWFGAGAATRREPGFRYAFAAAVAVWATFAGAFLVARDLFLTAGHYAAAVPFFLCIAVVAYINGRRVPARRRAAGLRARTYSRAYRGIAAAMIAVILATGVYLGVTAITGAERWFFTIFTVESVLVALFVAFWVLQTAENWRLDAVAEDAEQAAQVRSSRATTS